VPASDVLDGETYWREHFGIDSAQELQEQLFPLMPTWFRIGPGALVSTWFASAYNVPFSQPGVLARAAASVLNLAPTEKFAGTSILNNLFEGAEEEFEGSMTQLIVPDCFQVAINATCSGQEVVNVIGVRNAGGTAAGAAAAVKAAWEAGTTTAITAAVPSAYVVGNYRAVDISDPNGDIAVLTSTKTGSAAGQIATMGACALVQWNGGTRSRSSRGRLYLGPLTESVINTDGRTLLPATATMLNSAFGTFISQLGSAGYPPVVLSRKLSEAFPITTAATEAVIATQRRRIRN